MTKIRKYFIYSVSFVSFLILGLGTLFTIFRIQVQKQNNYFFEKIEKVNLLVKNNNFEEAKKTLNNIKLNPHWWNKQNVSNKKALIALINKKLGEPISKEVIEHYISKAENYENFNLVKECLLRIFFLEENSYENMQDFRWKHNMQRIHILSTLKADLRHKNILPKQLFDFYITNLEHFNHKLRLESLFIIMAAS